MISHKHFLNVCHMQNLPFSTYPVFKNQETHLNCIVEEVQGQRVTLGQAGNNRSKPKCGLFSKINFSFYTNVDFVPCFFV